MVICSLLLVNPATSATLERLFSMARHIKTLLRSIMTKSCFNSQGILHCHKEGTDKLDLAAVANEFLSKHDTRRSIFHRLTVKAFA